MSHAEKNPPVPGYVTIPGLGRDVPPKAPAQKNNKPPRFTKYGFPFGRYAANGVQWWFSYDKNLMGTKARKFVNGKWSTMVGAPELEAAVSVIQADMEAAAASFTAETQRCWDCGRVLSDPDSLKCGRGEICEAKPFADEMDGAGE